MKNTIIAILIFILASCTTGPSSEIKDYSEAIKSQAESMGQLLLKKDFKTFVKYTHPKIIEIMGGEAGMIAVLKEGNEAMEANGSSFVSVSFSEPSSLVVVDKELQCIIKQETEIETPEGNMISKSILIAVSTDEGKNWSFMDTNGQDITTLRKTVPTLSEQLVIPPKEEPVYK